jgi:hypothetical protein
VHNLDFKTGKIAASKPVDVQLAFDLESGQPPLRTRVDLKSRMNLDLEAQTLNVDSLTLALGDLALQTNFKGTHIFDALAVTGALEISPFNPRALMDKLDIKVETAGKTALTKLSLKTKFSATADSVELKDLAINLDASRLNGSLAARHFTKPAYLRSRARSDRLDAPPPAPAAASASAGHGSAGEVPLSALRAPAVQGQFRILQLKAMNPIRATR